METKTLPVQIPAGVTNDQEMFYQGEGDLVESAIPGDLVVKIKV